MDTIQKNFYEESCYDLVDNVIEGFNGTIFAYGQTGTGKTWTMEGPSGQPGLTSRAVRALYAGLRDTQGLLGR